MTLLRRMIQTTVLALLCWTTNAMGTTAVIYQPLLADMRIEASTWPTIFARLKRSGIDTLVLQWTQYDTAFASGLEATWLEQRVQDALTSGLNLIIGLSADSDEFRRLEQPNAVLPAYLRKLREKDRALVAKWQALIPPKQLKGWYLPLEIDDRRWRQRAAQDVLVTYLNQTRAELDVLQTEPSPLFISSFFTGQMSPQRYTDLIQTIHESTHTQVWVQNGVGVGKLTPSERALYLSSLTHCDAPAAQGLILEVFHQTSSLNQTFKAKPLSTATQKQALKRRAPCHLDTVFFGLNYLDSAFSSER